jgi:hypothetical protein
MGPIGGAAGVTGVEGANAGRGAVTFGAPVVGTKELRLGIPTGTPSSEPASLSRLWAFVTTALGSEVAARSLVVSAIRGVIPLRRESPGRPEPGSPEAAGVPKPPSPE